MASRATAHAASRSIWLAGSLAACTLLAPKDDELLGGSGQAAAGGSPEQQAGGAGASGVGPADLGDAGATCCGGTSSGVAGASACPDGCAGSPDSVRTPPEWTNTAGAAGLSCPEPMCTPVTAPVRVQSAYADSGNTVTPDSITVMLSAAATSGNLLALVANSDSKLTTPATSTDIVWRLAVSAVDSQALYIWYAFAAGGETEFRVMPVVARPLTAAVLEYAHVERAPPDVTSSRTEANGDNLLSAQTGTTSPTSQAAELVLAAIGPHDYTTLPVSVTWTEGFQPREGGGTSTQVPQTDTALFVGDKLTSVLGAQSASATWSNHSGSAGSALAAFKLVLTP